MKPFLAVLLLTLPLPAASIVNGGQLLTQANANQLAAWLGQGDLTLTDVYSGTPGAGNSTGFHTAVDGLGPTFSIIQTNLGLVGGFDPIAWSSSGNYNVDPDDSGRTAFLFNLSTGLKFLQRSVSQGSIGGDTGYYQTYNNSSYGPTFGGGHDLGIPSANLSNGYAYSYSYGNGTNGANLFGATGQLTSFNIVRVEAYTFSPQATATPEPAMFLLCGGALVLLRWLHRRYVRPNANVACQVVELSCESAA